MASMIWETSPVWRLNVRPSFVFLLSLVHYGSSERGKGIKSFLNSFPSPSTGVSSYIGVERIVNHNRDNFHAGRPAGNFGPPVSLFNPALGLFDHRLRHLDHESSIVDLPPSLVQLAHMFMAVAADSYPDEHTWASSIKDILSQIFPATLNWEVSQTWFGIKPGAIKFGDTPFFVVVKNEAGLEGDSSLEAALSYAHIATSPVDTVKFFYVHCYCHSFLLMWIVGLTEAIELSRHAFELSCCSLRYHG